jgi:hypothetical protein
MSAVPSVPPRPYQDDPTVSQSRSGVRYLVLGAHATLALAVVLLAVLHVDARWGGIDPVTAMLSDYAERPGWWMWDLALILTSAGSLAVLLALRHQGVLRGRAAVGGMSVWCLSILLVAVFTKDPQGGAVTVTGKAHLYATAASCGSLPLAGWALGRRHCADSRWRVYAVWSRRLALWSVPSFLPFIVPFAVNVLLGWHGILAVPTGLVERLMVALDLGLLAVFGIWARHASSVDAPATATNFGP